MSAAPMTDWDNALQRLAVRALGKQPASALLAKFQPLLTPDYQALVSPRYGLQDLLHLGQINAPDSQRVSLLNPCQDVEHYRLHFYSGQERYLDEYIPLLENMSLRVMDQVQFRVPLADMTLYIKSFTIKAAKSQCASLPILRARILATVQAVMDGKVENDTLNKLVVVTGMDWQAVDLLRAYRNYYLQLGHHTTKATVHHALVNNPQVSLALFNYFEARFRPNPAWDDPLLREEQVLSPFRLQLLTSMASVADINDDRILRTLFNLIDATMRANYHLRRTLVDYFIAFKINSLGVIDMPNPKPKNEIYVHAVDMEGIHLRGGKISRGGIRWSDRPDDFRTEILGLMQTQISKNALIIPTGAKGGFVIKKNGSKTDVKVVGKQAYIRLMRGLLDLTDNYSDGGTVAKLGDRVVYDDPDPYLVVAADKGTAQFSDIANGVAAEYGFWLDDAFASGGSSGYDHKALGITARGAWECVKRHFRELGKDIQNEAFSVVGIGSMDGDVFGNGMLLSPFIRLRAAFSGQHIFIDPHPADSEDAFNERNRLFNLPGSSWNDYDRSLISDGGGVYLRSDKDIVLSAELKKWLGIRYKSLDGESLIRYLLTAPIDLLWLGGIGTYVKASTEKHEDVGDRNNDAVRVDAINLTAKVVGEGANLGFTQKARSEYALRGGCINTDAVDNSAGVDTSDHEVNLKILLRDLQKKALIADYQALFIDMTTAVCGLVLANNIAQSRCLSLEQRRSKTYPGQFLQVAERLEAAGFLDKTVESFPPDKDILARPGQSLTRPEFAVLMAASKMYLTAQIEEQSALLQEDCCACYLQDYFPNQITAHYSDQLADHPLASNIKATIVSNKVINQAGSGFLDLDIDDDNVTLLDAVGCYLTFDRVLDGNALRQAIDALDTHLTVDKHYELRVQLEDALLNFCRWALVNGKKIRPTKHIIEEYSRHLQAYAQYFKQVGCSEMPLFQRYLQEGVPDSLAQQLVFIGSLNDFPLLVALSAETACDFVVVHQLFNEIGQFLALPDFVAKLLKLPTHDEWERKVLDDLQGTVRRVAGDVLKSMLASDTPTCAEYFSKPSKQRKLTQYRRIHQSISNTSPVSVSAYVVLVKALEPLVF
ncbi:MAG: NAD-glutamate dehydrogenase [Methylovulum sp.]|nr:NAD-glutamate dehydrogenase [Methylovulum sp.]